MKFWDSGHFWRSRKLVQECRLTLGEKFGTPGSSHLQSRLVLPVDLSPLLGQGVEEGCGELRERRGTGKRFAGETSRFPGASGGVQGRGDPLTRVRGGVCGRMGRACARAREGFFVVGGGVAVTLGLLRRPS